MEETVKVKIKSIDELIKISTPVPYFEDNDRYCLYLKHSEYEPIFDPLLIGICEKEIEVINKGIEYDRWYVLYISSNIIHPTRKHRNDPEEEYKFKLADWMLENEI